VRMFNRRGFIFDPSALRYAEISDVPLALRNLMRRGFLRKLEASDYGAWLCILKKDALLTVAKAADHTDVRSSWPKAKLIDYFLQHVPFALASQHGHADRYVVLANMKPVKFLLYLYFGKTYEDLKSF